MRGGLPWMALDGAEAVAVLDQRWDALVSLNPRATVFQSSAWYQAWLETVADAERASLRVLLAGPREQPRAGLALQLSAAQTGVPTIRPLSWPWADYHEAVGSPLDRQAVLGLIDGLRHLRERERVAFDLDELVPGGMLVDIARELGLSESDASPTEAIDLNDAAHVARVLASREHHLKLRRLQRVGAVELDHHATLERVMSQLSTFIEMHREQWRGRADAVAPFDGGVVEAAFTAMVQQLAPRGQLLLTVLSVAGAPAAMYFGFVRGRWYGGYRTTFDPQLFRFSPGHLMLRGMISEFGRVGFERLDLMRGAYGYKSAYSSATARNRRFRSDLE